MTAQVHDDQAPCRRSRWFILGYGAAQAGAFIAFIPLLTVLLPSKAAALGAVDKEILLGQLAMIGGFTAAVANLMFGAISDRFGPLGRRKPWILTGLLFVAVALVLIAFAPDVPALFAAVVAFQVAMNALYAPLCAVLADQVPDRQKGLVAAWAGGALPIANLFTAIFIARNLDQPLLPYAAIIIAVSLLVLPFAITLHEPVRGSRSKPKRKPRLSLEVLKDRSYAFAFASRLMIESAIALHTLYLLFLLAGLPALSRPAGWSVAQAFGVLLLSSTLAAAACGFLAGALSDRLGQRRHYVMAGAFVMATALGMLSLWQNWAGLMIAQILFGMGHGVHAAAVAAMTAEILPDSNHAGRDLGVMNLAVSLPQAIAPGAAALALGFGFDLSMVFAGAGLVALTACPLLAGIRKSSALR